MRMIGLCVCLLAAASPSPAAQDERGMGGVGILVFTEPGFGGQNASFRRDVADLRSYGLNDRIHALRVAAGETWEVCEHSGYRGRCQVFHGEEQDLRDRGWAGMISSMRRVRGPGSPGLPPTYPPPGVRTLQLYDQRGFTGDWRSIDGAVADLRSIDFDDRARSLRLPRSQSWQVCADAYFRNCRVVNTDWADLTDLAMGRRISSVRPWSQGGGPPPRPEPGRAELVLYDQRDFRGPAYTLTQPMTSLQAPYGIRSARVRGSWEVCDGTRFTGNCAVISSDVRDLGAIGLRGRVQSARPAAGPY
jgi:hypothetical protein